MVILLKCKVAKHAKIKTVMMHNSLNRRKITKELFITAVVIARHIQA